MIRYDSKARPIDAREVLRRLAILLPSHSPRRLTLRDAFAGRWM